MNFNIITLPTITFLWVFSEYFCYKAVINHHQDYVFYIIYIYIFFILIYIYILYAFIMYYQTRCRDTSYYH